MQTATLVAVGAATALATRYAAAGLTAGLGELWPRRRTRLGPVLACEPGEPEAQHREFGAACETACRRAGADALPAFATASADWRPPSHEASAD